MKEVKVTNTCAEINNSVLNVECPKAPPSFGADIKEFTYQIHPKKKGLHKVTIEFLCADPFGIKEIIFK